MVLEGPQVPAGCSHDFKINIFKTTSTTTSSSSIVVSYRTQDTTRQKLNFFLLYEYMGIIHHARKHEYSMQQSYTKYNT